MSGVRSRHLERRCGIYGVRVRVPDDIRPLLGRVEVRRSLRTSDPALAQAQSALIAVRLFGVFEMIRQHSDCVTRDDIEAFMAQIFIEVGRRMRAGWAFPRAELLRSPCPSRAGPTVGEAVDAYIASRKSSWTAKTAVSRVQKLGFLKEHLGPGTILSDISVEDIRQFRDAICRLRANKGSSPLTSFASRQTENVEHRINPKTATLIFEPAKAFFRWCKSEQGYISANPAEDVRMAVIKGPKGAKPRRPFTAEELTKMFSSPLFTGCMSASRRFEPGPMMIRDAKYWLPVLGYYTGARLGELVQLHHRDVDLCGGVPFLNITEEHAGKAGTSEAKHVKSEAGVRRVPLHPDLIELGFDRFVEARRAAKGSSKRLFHEVSFGSDGQASTVFSKFFGRLLDKVGLPDPALVFHSFRHGAEDAFRNALQPQYVIDRIIGHSDGATSAAYGQGVSLEIAHASVASMRLAVRLTELWSGIPGISTL